MIKFSILFSVVFRMARIIVISMVCIKLLMCMLFRKWVLVMSVSVLRMNFSV